MEWTDTPLIWGEIPMGPPGHEDGRFHLPAGTVTFMLTDVEGSTRLWAEFPDDMGRAVGDSYEIIARAVADHDGVRPVEQGEGDSVFGAFSRASDAVAAALQVQLGLHRHQWPDGMQLRVRIALHTADAQLRDEGNYFGLALSRTARLRAIAAGGQTLLSRGTRDLVVDRLPDGVDLADCGTHRLRDLGRPEHVFALTHPDLAQALAPLRSLDAFPNNLPDQLSTFVGREDELAQLRDAMRETRLLTLTGAGGAGKTRLALQLVADLLDHFPDGAWWVDLAPVTDDQRVVDTLAGALGVRPLPGVTALEASCGWLAHRRALVVIDNCEHLLAASSDTVEAVLRACPEVCVIATSRTPLGVDGETDWRVPSLSLPAPERRREPLEIVGQSDAVRLFIERARKARPNFAVTNDSAPAVAQICHELDGLPLAIELAAARVRMMSVDQIAAGLGDRFHLLTRGTRTALPRHQTLRASVDWSYALLSAAERTLLRRLAVFAGGFSLDLAEAACADASVERVAILDLLASLVEKSLVIADEQMGAVRYRLLETVRQYALERLIEADESTAMLDRHRDALLAFAEEIEPKLHLRGQREWLEVLDQEDANLTAALDRAIDTDAETALRLCVALTFWWKLRGRFVPAERGFVRALAAADPAPSSTRARALFGRGYLASYALDVEVAGACLQEACEMAEKVGDHSTLARALMMAGWLQLLRDPDLCRATSERALQLARASHDDWAYSTSTMNIAFAHFFQGRLNEGERILDEMVPLLEQRGYLELRAWLWLGRCWRTWARGDVTLLDERATRALEFAHAAGEPSTEALAHCFIAGLELARGNAEAAVDRLAPTRTRMIELGAGLAVRYTDYFLAPALAAVGRAAEARSSLEQAVAEGLDQGYMLASTQAALADLLRVAGEPESARRHATEALEIAQRMRAPQVTGSAHELLGRLATLEGDWSRAQSALQQALEIRFDHGFAVSVPQTIEALAEVANGLGSHHVAARLLGAADRARGELELKPWAPDRPRLDRCRETSREAIGDAGFERAFGEGRQLAPADAVAWIRRARGERRRPERGWESLTPTEQRVVELVAEGLTNPQIGERMFISRGTVKVHLSHIFAKLSVATRAELAAEAARRAVASRT
jgi:predicted ATPase/class 3 adenylate cyclase/DNA-binding CsgD family transcriptional regulator